MKRLTMAALVCAGTFAFAAPSQAAPLSAAGVLGNESTRSATNEMLVDEDVIQVRGGHGDRGHHYGWSRGHHYGWYKHRSYPRYYAPRHYGFVPYRSYRYY